MAACIAGSRFYLLFIHSSILPYNPFPLLTHGFPFIQNR
ncbi:hypothetical protein GA0116948_12211 [Chitinophaga costaii]|uniref:Uncharacterized protein n=1 Tax=Chitinophaga costaii TaxID=1335309 RepID=A0A1C4G4E6_9BACT|nr:hypothetical protein GA0116948_12211 [Chitinophaga costaii]